MLEGVEHEVCIALTNWYIRRIIIGYINVTSILEKEIINALKINSKIDWSDKNVNEEFLELIKFVKKLFREEY